MRRHSLALGVALLCGSGASALAQDVPDTLPIGACIRIRAPDAGVIRFTGAVVDGSGPDTLYVRDVRDPRVLRDVDRLAVPWVAVERLDLSVGRKSRWSRAGKGALWGLGVAGAYAAVFVVSERAGCTGADCVDGGSVLLGLIGITPFVAGTGAAIGFALPVERWRRVTLLPR